MVKLEIEHAENGYIVSWMDEYDDGTPLPKKRVVREFDNEFGELEAMQELLYEVKDFFGVGYNKHASKNLVIKFEDEAGQVADRLSDD